MATDRKKLEAAIRMVEGQIGIMRYMTRTTPADAADQVALVVRAAQAHLDTLPKPPLWRVTGLTSKYIRDESMPYADHEIALGVAKTWLKAGYINVSVLAVS